MLEGARVMSAAGAIRENVRIRRHILKALLFFASALPAAAQEPRLAAHLYFNTPAVTLSYAWTECPHECRVLDIVCFPRRDVRIFIVDVPGPAIAEWFRFDVIDPLLPAAELVVAGASVTLNFSSLTFGELNGAWRVEMFPAQLTWLEAFAAHEATLVRSVAFEIALPNTAADQAVRAAFVEACMSP